MIVACGGRKEEDTRGQRGKEGTQLMFPGSSSDRSR